MQEIIPRTEAQSKAGILGIAIFKGIMPSVNLVTPSLLRKEHISSLRMWFKPGRPYPGRLNDRI